MRASPNHKKMKQCFSDKLKTAIYHAEPEAGNDYLPEKVSLAGYKLLDLIQQKTFIEVIYLMLSGELPDTKIKSLLDKLMVGFINLGPQHPAIRAAMTAGVSRTNIEHILPIGLIVLGGAERGAKEVEQAYYFIQQAKQHQPKSMAAKALSKMNLAEKHTEHEGDVSLVPGFGSLFGGVDRLSIDIATMLVKQSDFTLTTLNWVIEFGRQLNAYRMGCLPTAIVAAVGQDIGLGARETLALFQLICSPGIVAQGVEQSYKPITAMPFLDDDQYHYVQEK